MGAEVLRRGGGDRGPGSGAGPGSDLVTISDNSGHFPTDICGVSCQSGSNSRQNGYFQAEYGYFRVPEHRFLSNPGISPLFYYGNLATLRGAAS